MTITQIPLEHQKFIKTNSDYLSIPDLAKETGVHYDTIYRYIASNGLSMTKHLQTSNARHKHNYTKNYQTCLFNAIKRLERELCAGSTQADRELIKNMKLEYNEAVSSTKAATDKLRYFHLGGSVLHLWKPKLVIVEEKINS